MTPTPMRVLFASRAYESHHTEGGFLILKDLAMHAATDAATQAAFFSTCRQAEVVNGVELIPAYNRGGWNTRTALQFARSLSRSAADFHIVHTAHVPTVLNTAIQRRIRRRTKMRGPRYVQTVTAIATDDKLRPDMFWGDAIVCLNDMTSNRVRQFHENVITIAPVARQQRLEDRQSMPAEIRRRLAAYKIVCIPVDVERLGDFNIRGLCTALLNSRNDIAVVFACRFGDEQKASRLLGSLMQTQTPRLHVFATIDWMLDLLAVSDCVVYPISDLQKKFNPPMVLLEAAQLGSRIVTASSIVLEGLVRAGACQSLASNRLDEWVDAVSVLVDVGEQENTLLVSFDDVYSRYAATYRALRENSGR